MKSYIQVKKVIELSVIAFLMFISAGFNFALAQNITVQSAVVAPGGSIVVPIEMTNDITQVTGFQMDLSVAPVGGAPAAAVTLIDKGTAVTTAPGIDSNPVPPTGGPVRIGLPVEIPASGTIIPDFDGPGTLLNLTIDIPAGAIPGQAYQLNLNNVILAGPNHPFADLSVFGGTLTVGAANALADTLSTDTAFTVDEGQTRELTAAVTGSGQPIPGVTLSFSIDNPDKASFSAGTAVTGTDGIARINLTGLEDGTTTLRVFSAILGESTINLTVLGISPIITSSPLLETTPGAAYSYDVDATDPQSQALTYSLTANPVGMTIDSNTGIITWPNPARPTPTETQVTITIEVRDPDNNTDSQTFDLFIVVDEDNDGWDDRTDCDDTIFAINPGQTEIPYNGLDDDCSPATPDDDLDGDGFNTALDCDDTNPSVNPDATEILYNGLDDDCNPSTIDYIDDDDDGYFTEQNANYPNPPDCNDANPNVNPGQTEIPENGLDDDCNPNTPDTLYATFIIPIDDNGRAYYAKSNGDGTFTEFKQLINIGGNSRGVAINDFNNDGYLDFIIGITGTQHLYTNNGDDTFTAQGSFDTLSSTGSWTMDMSTGDFNNDGFMDFTANANSAVTGIYLGDGTGSFTKTEISLGGSGRGVDAADFNNDGKLDFARARYSDGFTYIHLGNGDGTFAAPVYIGDPGNDPYGLAAADFDNDGNVDIIVNSGGGGDPFFFKGNGDGTFISLGYIASLDFNNHGAYDAYDFNADGNMDIVASSYSSRIIRFYPGNGDGTFGTAVQIGTTSGYCLGISGPPQRIFGRPYAVLLPSEQTIALGDTANLDGSFSNDNDDSGTIVSWDWDFGDTGSGTGSTVTHNYAAEGTYKVQLAVTDNSGFKDFDHGKIIVQGEVPVANHGGPYTFGEAFADNGVYTFMLDGSGSTDDFNIDSYLWHLDDDDNFPGTDLDTLKWIVTTGITQDETITIIGAGSWSNRYMATQNNLIRKQGLTFTARILPVNETGGQTGMFGFKNTGTNYSYTQMPYAFYFNNNNLHIYEDGSNRGVFTTYNRNQAYDIKIELKTAGAKYFFKLATDSTWELLRDSSHSTLSDLKIGWTVSGGSFEVDDVEIDDYFEGISPTVYLSQGTYPVSLTITDTAGQQNTDSTTIDVVTNDPPVADPGGPYTADESNAVAGEWLVEFDGSGSTDDHGILKYEWDFDDSDGIQINGTGPAPIYFYNTAGVYTITLTVTDHALQTHTQTTTVTIDLSGTFPPVSDPGGPYTVNEESAFEGLWTVIFDGSGSSDDQAIARYLWDFGDGNTLTTWYAKERQNFFEVGTRLYGYDVPQATLDIIGTQNNTKVKIVDLETGQVLASNTINRYTAWNNVSLADGTYFKVEADKPILAYQTDDAAHSAFVPSLDAGPVGHEFIFRYFTSNGFYVYAFEDTVVRAFNTSGTLMAEQSMTAGSYWNPGLSNQGIYRFISTGKISMQTVGMNAYTAVPSAEGDGAGSIFYCATYQWSTGAFAIFAYDNADITVRDMDTDDILYTRTMAQGETWWQTGVGTRRLKIESTADVEVWAGDTEGGTGITNFGDDISFAGGRNNGKEFYTHGLAGGLVIFAPYDGTIVNIDGLDQTLNKDEFLPLSGGALYHITSNHPIVIQTLGRANTFNDMGTYLGGVSEVTHEYDVAGTYTLSLTVYDQGNQSHTQATTVEVSTSDSPVSSHGGPYVVNEGEAQGGLWRVVMDASGSTDDFGIFKYEWDFDDSDGIGIDSTEINPTHFYDAPGTYTITLRVYDHAMQMTEVTTTVTVDLSNPPAADAGGPYELGEESAKEGKYLVTLDGSDSTDDFGIYSYKWSFGDNFIEPFNGTVINDTRWITSEGVAQDDMITITGNGAWGQRYEFTQKNFKREGGNVFTFKVRSHSAGTNTIMAGLKNNSTNYSYTHMPYAIYMNSNEWFYIYEDGANRGNFATFATDTWYDLKIELKPVQGARYYYKPADQTDWILLYNSNHATRATLFKAGATVANGIHDIDDVKVETYGIGIGTTHVYDSPGTYPVSLTVADHALQTDTDTTTVEITAGDSPVADAGGPYTGEPFSFIKFNGGASSDDTAIAQYSWDFGDGYTGKGAGAIHFYRTAGTYTVTLTVYDNLLQSDTDTTTVVIETGTIPIAEAGGPYIGGVGGPPVYFDGSSSSDDSGILNYTWDLILLDEDFSNTSLNPDTYISGSSGTGSVSLDNEEMVIQGNTSASWGSAYLTTHHPISRKQGTSFSGRIKTDGESAYFMIGWKDNTTLYRYQELVHGIYFTTGNDVYIYEDGASRGAQATYANDTWYDFRIELKSTGALYYLDDVLIYDSNHSSESNLRPMMTAASRTQRTDDWVIDGISIDGKTPEYTYPVAGTYPVTLIVEDGAGQTSSATGSVQIVNNLPPKVICVPWVSTDLKFPHETYNGKEVTLKGIVKDADPSTYQWDFGDGTSSGVLSVTNTYDLSIKHTYPVVPNNTPFIATLTVWDSNGESGSDNYNIVVKEKTIDVEINAGIDDGLWYLHRTMDRTGGANDGRWTGYSSYYASPTGSALQAFQINTHLKNGDPQENPYVETVARGLKYLFTRIRSADIAVQTYGDPDTNGNGIGIEVASGRAPYEGGMVMMAIAASGTPLAKTRTGGTNINKRFYYDILTDMVDMYAYGMSDSATIGGGWRYAWKNNPDSSACQWGALGLEAAEDAFNIHVPEWVKERNRVWINYSWDGTGWGYTGRGNGVATTPSGLAQMAFDDIPRTDWRWINAEGYLASQWDAWYNNTRNYYALYALAKALRISLPDEVTTMAEGTPWAIDWYRDNERGAARTVLTDQKEDGSFRDEGIGSRWIAESAFRTAWGVVILSKTLFVKPPVADAGPDRVYGINWELTLDGSGSYHTDPFRNIIRYEWDINSDGIYDYTGTSPIITHTYQDLGIYTVTLRVTDDNIPPKFDTDTANINIAIPPHPPVSDPGGPYTTTSNVARTLDGTGSFDIDPSDAIFRYGWEIDGDYPYDFDDAFGPNPSHTWTVDGTYNVGLKVWDNGVLNDINDNGTVDEDERLTDIQWTTVTVVTNYPPVADANGPYTVDEGTPVTLDGSGSTDPNNDPLTYAWDLDNDGSFDDATGVNPEHTWMDNGTYTIGLEVSDSTLTDTVTAVVIVNDLGPASGFSWAPNPQGEGLSVSFTDTSTSPADSITSWSWNFAGLGTSTVQNPGFIFMDNGTYTVTLTITDEDGSTSTVSHDVSISDRAPTAAFTWAPQPQLEGEPVGFTDTSTSSPDVIVSWAWDFAGLGTSTDQNPSFTFVDNGTYSVNLTVTDEDGSTSTISHTVTIDDRAPAAEFTWLPQPQFEGEAVSFTDTSTSPLDNIMSWSWNFAGLGTSTAQNPGFTFTDNGTYAVSLTVTDEDGSTSTVSHNVIIEDTGLIGAFTWTPEPQLEGLNVNFTDTSSSHLDLITGWAWDFAGLGISTAQHPSFTFMDNGTYTVTLTVTDEDGSTNSVSHDVHIADRGPLSVLTGDSLLDEGQTGSYDASGSTSSPDAIVGFDWDWSYDGTVFNPSSDTGVTQSHTWPDNDTYSIAVRITDDDGSMSIGTLDITVRNVSPLVEAGPDQVVNEGDIVSFNGSFTDPGTADTHTITWDFGDGSPGSTGTLTPTHVYPDNGIYTVTLTVLDDDGGAGSDTLIITILSSAPLCGDLDHDGDVDFTDRDIFMTTYRLCSDQQGFISEADYDGDGCITLNDYREWYICYRLATGDQDNDLDTDGKDVSWVARDIANGASAVEELIKSIANNFGRTQ